MIMRLASIKSVQKQSVHDQLVNMIRGVLVVSVLWFSSIHAGSLEAFGNRNSVQNLEFGNRDSVRNREIDAIRWNPFRTEGVIDTNTNQRNAQRPVDFIRSHGYPVEEHSVTTVDGYVLTLFRIPHGVKNATNTEVRKEPVFIQHGLMSSAMDFLVTGPERALGFILADAGFDVWLGNTRGSRYSRSHRDLSPEEKQFWQFSWHEIGERDLPAMINYVLEKTRYKKLHYVGHSQGTTAYFVMCSVHPSMQEKIQTMNAMAPIAYMKHLYSPLVRFIAPFSDMISKMYNYTRTGEVMQQNDLLRMAGYDLCRGQSGRSPFVKMCVNMIYLIGGWGSDQLDEAQIGEILKYSPSSSSIFQLAHYGQGMNSGDFGEFNFGRRANMQRYTNWSPPKYDLSRVTSRVALHYSDNDWLAAVVDVDKLGDQVTHLVGKYRVTDTKFNHMDFCWGKSAKQRVYDRVIGVMRRYAMQEYDYRGGNAGERERENENASDSNEFGSDWNSEKVKPGWEHIVGVGVE